MLSRALVLLVALGQTSLAETAPDPTALVRQLGAPRFADRQAAAAELERLGSPAVPALRRRASVSRHGDQNPGSGPAPENRDGPPHSADFGTPRIRGRNDLGCHAAIRSAGQTGFKIALYPQNLPRVEKISELRCTILKGSVSGRPSTRSATPPRSSTIRACKDLPVNRIRCSRSLRASFEPSRRFPTKGRSACGFSGVDYQQARVNFAPDGWRPGPRARSSPARRPGSRPAAQSIRAGPIEPGHHRALHRL